MDTTACIMDVPRRVAEATAPAVEGKAVLTPHDVFVRVGMLTRNLHDTLRQLGYDKGVEAAVGSLPDARAPGLHRNADRQGRRARAWRCRTRQGKPESG